MVPHIPPVNLWQRFEEPWDTFEAVLQVTVAIGTLPEAANVFCQLHWHHCVYAPQIFGQRRILVAGRDAHDRRPSISAPASCPLQVK